jgi:hypothetical protein
MNIYFEVNIFDLHIVIELPYIAIFLLTAPSCPGQARN